MVLVRGFTAPHGENPTENLVKPGIPPGGNHNENLE